MIRMLLVAAPLALLAALPASAQLTTVYTAACVPHGSDQLRCAARLGLLGDARQHDTFLLPTGDGRITGLAQLWTSECGLPGQSSPPQPTRNHSSHRLQWRGGFNGTLLFCAEIFITNCQEMGQPVPCARGFGNATIRTETR